MAPSQNWGQSRLCAEMSRTLSYTLLCKFGALSTHMSTTKTLSVTCYSTPRLQNESRKPSFIYFIVIWISFFFFFYLQFWAFWSGSPRCFTNMPCSFLFCICGGGHAHAVHACGQRITWNQFATTIMWVLGRDSCHQLGSRCLNLLSHLTNSSCIIFTFISNWNADISIFPAKYVSFYIIE